MKPIPSIRSRLNFLVAACLLPASLISVGLLFYGYQQSQHQLLDHAMTTARTVSSLTDQHFSNVAGTLQALATSPSLTSGDLAAFYQQALEVLPTQNVANVVLTDPQGMQLFNTLRPFGEALPENQSSIRAHHFGESNASLISDLFYGPVARRHVIAIAVPVRRQNEILYSLSTGMSPQPFAKLLAQAQLPPGWVTAVLDSQGTIVARSQAMEQFIGKSASPDLMNTMSAARQGVMEGVALDANTPLAAYKRSSTTGWTVIIGIPSQILEQELRETLVGLGLAIILLFAFSLLVAKKLGRRITDAIHGLTGPAIALGEGRTVAVPPLELAEANEVGKALVRASGMLEKARYQATHDTLTGLGNRSLFYEIVSQQITLAARNKSAVSVLFIDLDGFKPINDNYGHATGDLLLCYVASQLRLSLRKSDFAARMGGDEFAVILVDTSSEDAAHVANKILASLAAPCRVRDTALQVGASIGIASYPEAGQDVRELLHAADTAMYEAKSCGKNQVVISCPGKAA